MEGGKATTMGTAGSLVLCGESTLGYSGHCRKQREETERTWIVTHLDQASLEA